MILIEKLKQEDDEARHQRLEKGISEQRDAELAILYSRKGVRHSYFRQIHVHIR